MPRVYLDHAATTPLLPQAIEAMTEQMSRGGNPSSLHSSGRAARASVEYAREHIARLAGCDAAEIIFTSGGTEADNLAIKGLYWKQQQTRPSAKRIIVSAIEHHAVSDSVEWLETQEGAQITWLQPDAQGLISPAQVEEAIQADPESVALITVMWANNEVGTIQPIREIAALAALYGIPFHTDAVQAFGSIPVNFKESGASTMAISAHKMGGPMGIGALIASRSTQLTPLLHGGGQERSVRSGTIDAASIVGFGAAAAQVSQGLLAEAQRQAQLRDQLIQGIQAAIPQAQLQGAAPEETQDRATGDFTRLPGNVHFTFPGCEGDSLLFLLDMAGIDSSTGSACNAGVPRPSTVLLAMGLSEEEARGAQRFTLGHTSSQEDVTALLSALPAAWEQARKAGMAGQVLDQDRWS